MYGYIYKITNNTNKKIYIGQTTRTIEKRVQEHFTRALYYTTKYDKDEYKYVHLYLAIKKYGEASFTYEQIDTALTQEELNEKEGTLAKDRSLCCGAVWPWENSSGDCFGQLQGSSCKGR